MARYPAPPWDTSAVKTLLNPGECGWLSARSKRTFHLLPLDGSDIRWERGPAVALTRPPEWGQKLRIDSRKRRWRAADARVAMRFSGYRQAPSALGCVS